MSSFDRGDKLPPAGPGIPLFWIARNGFCSAARIYPSDESLHWRLTAENVACTISFRFVDGVSPIRCADKVTRSGLTTFSAAGFPQKRDQRRGYETASRKLVRPRPRKFDELSVYQARLDGRLVNSRNRYRLIDLFAGAGGMTLGFTKSLGHAFLPVWANDFNDSAVETYIRNFGSHATSGDIVDVLTQRGFHVPTADVVIGGPPCQGFSLLNKQRDGDERKQLWRPFLDVVQRSKARVFVMENVPQLLGSFEHGEILERARSMNFSVAYAKLLSADYGVPQTRSRAFIIGCKFADPTVAFPPKRTHFGNNNGKKHLAFDDENFLLENGYVPDAVPWKTVRDAIGDLPRPRGTEIRDETPPLNLHFGRNPTPLSRKRYRAIPREGMNRIDLRDLAPELTPGCWIRKKSGGTDLFGRLWWNRPAFTVRTEFFKPEKGRYLHPKQHRPITHREAARFQSFPDSFVFSGSKIEIAKQIGNAVPPALAARIADSVYALLIGDKRKRG